MNKQCTHEGGIWCINSIKPPDFVDNKAEYECVDCGAKRIEHGNFIERLQMENDRRVQCINYQVRYNPTDEELRQYRRSLEPWDPPVQPPASAYAEEMVECMKLSKREVIDGLIFVGILLFFVFLFLLGYYMR